MAKDPSKGPERILAPSWTLCFPPGPRQLREHVLEALALPGTPGHVLSREGGDLQKGPGDWALSSRGANWAADVEE